MLPSFNPYRLFILIIRKNWQGIIKGVFLILLGSFLLIYGFFLYNQLELRVNLSRAMIEPDLFELFSLRKKYERGFRAVLISWKSPLPERLFEDTGEFLDFMRSKLGKRGKLVQEDILKKLVRIKYTEKSRGKNRERTPLPSKTYRNALVDLLASSRYRAILGKEDNSFPLTVRLFLEAYSRPYKFSATRKICSPFPCCRLNPLPYQILSLSALALHTSLVRYLCMGEGGQMEYISDLTRASLIFARRLEVEGVKVERKEVAQHWGWRILLPWDRFKTLAAPLSMGTLPERDITGEACPYPYNLSLQRRIISTYFLLAGAYYTSITRGKVKRGVFSFQGMLAGMEASGTLVHFHMAGTGVRSLTLVRNSPLACDSVLSRLLEKIAGE